MGNRRVNLKPIKNIICGEVFSVSPLEGQVFLGVFFEGSGGGGYPGLTFFYYCPTTL